MNIEQRNTEHTEFHFTWNLGKAQGNLPALVVQKMCTALLFLKLTKQQLEEDVTFVLKKSGQNGAIKQNIRS